VENSNEQAWPVGTLTPNDFGLFDVYGHVVEWCQDAFAVDYDKSPPKSDLDRIVDVSHERLQEGGAFSQIGTGIGSAARSWTALDIRSSRTGFRISRTIH
jgi:formylglycine-generating enzyme required for sulfatase activity